MGFGLLLIGYLITYIVALNTYGAAFRLLGYIVIAYAAFKLSEYERKFRLTAYVSAALALLSAISTAQFICEHLYDNMILSSNPFGGVFATVMPYIDAIGVFALQLVLLLAIKKIARDTEVHNIELNAGRNIFFVSLYFILSVVGYLPLPFKESYARYMGLPLVILYIAWIAFQIGILFSCYARICDESDVEMERKPSRFAFVNKFRAELDAKQEKARRESEEYKRAKQEKRREKKNRGK